ncbi:hypothetical protein HHK36_017097 [Tetracentron sinense]|uniref:Uncharacterized protein n=1 Tax=Tetracentron sinense TaxID=13715 RepID=A0A834Z3X7_TETSI|nr:hypothetical protein HHK36_017097 [Tetracentron sinense]
MDSHLNWNFDQQQAPPPRPPLSSSPWVPYYDNRILDPGLYPYWHLMPHSPLGYPPYPAPHSPIPLNTAPPYYPSSVPHYPGYFGYSYTMQAVPPGEKQPHFFTPNPPHFQGARTGPLYQSVPMQTPITPPPPPPPSFRVQAPSPQSVFHGPSSGSQTRDQKHPPSGHDGDSIKATVEEHQLDNKGKWPILRRSRFYPGGTSTDTETANVKTFRSRKKKRNKQKLYKRPRIIPCSKVSLVVAGDMDPVESVLMNFEGLRRKFTQLDDMKDSVASTKRRPDLEAGTLMMRNGLQTNIAKRVGPVPGVSIGAIFFCRFELCLVGLHTQIMSPIDYIRETDQAIAISVVTSAEQDDVEEVDDGEVLILMGQGGRSRGRQLDDQKATRGNLAMLKSLKRRDEIRVIRGTKEASVTIYIYDGLYTIYESWTEMEDESGFMVFKYKMRRVPGQAVGYSIWKSLKLWKQDLSSRPGSITEDIAAEMETLAVSVVNEVDEEEGPPAFRYIPTLQFRESDSDTEEDSIGCSCHSMCQPGDRNCFCAGGVLPYTLSGALVIWKPVIYECGPSCRCYSDCPNRLSQNGLRVRLEIYKTPNKGWGLRSLDAIRSGTFICEYAGRVMEINELKENDQDEYIFDATFAGRNCLEYWNYNPELLGEEKNDNMAAELPEVIISAKKMGNVARFMNHSCSPNVFWQLVQHGHENESYPHVVFFAIGNIAPLTELTYNYGIREPKSEDGEAGCSYVSPEPKICLCGSTKCMGFFG